ncbi:MAG: LamG-like jellyroll fold domain-containing protein [Planctomycetota bacterium]|jgi:hypothetical protein
MMKRKMTVFLVMAMSMLAVRPHYARADLNDGLVAWYPFSGNAYDASANGNHGTVFGATLTQDICNDANSAYAFDGVDDYIDIQNEAQFDFASGDFAIGAWIHPTSTQAAYAGIVSKWSSNSGSGWSLEYEGTTERMRLCIKDAGWACAVTDSAIPQDEWTHILGQVKGTTVEVYVNEVLQQTPDTLNGNRVTNDRTINIGREQDDYAAFNGNIDEVRLYSRALDASEIEELHNQGVLCCMPPTITGHPSPPSLLVCQGESHEYCVTASGSEPLSYQWQKDDSNIPGATGPCYTINPVTAADAGSYTCVVSNSCGSAESNAAALTVDRSDR